MWEQRIDLRLRGFRGMLAVLLQAGLSVSCTEAPGAEVVLVDEGVPRATIVLRAEADLAEREAAAELRDYVRYITGAELLIATEEPGRGGASPRIFLGLDAWATGHGADPSTLAPEGFLIRTVEDDVVLGARDDHGIRFAVTHFLETFGGVRWFWPGEGGEVVPSRARFAVPAVDLRSEPSFRMRELGSDRWEGILGDWRRRNKLGSFQTTGQVHVFADILPPAEHFAEHPEYYALVNGKRGGPALEAVLAGTARTPDHLGWQLCTTNPDVIQAAVAYACRQLDEYGPSRIVSISPNDGFGFCGCDACRALDTGQQTTLPNGRRVPAITDRLLVFANAVAREVARTHPDGRLLLLAYGMYREPPLRERPEPNLLIQFAAQAAEFVRPEVEGTVFEQLRGWAAVTQELAIWEYYDLQNWPCLPRIIVGPIGTSIPRYRDYGARWFYSQATNDFATNGINYYLAAKLLWDVTLDPRAVLDDYYRVAFGEAGPAIRAYHDELAAGWARVQRDRELSELWMVQQVKHIFDQETLERCRAQLDEAERLASDEGARARVAFLREGFRWTEAHVRAEMALQAVEAAGIDLGVEGDALPAGSRTERQRSLELLRQALGAWEERAELLERFDQSVVIASWKIRGRWQRSHDVLPELRATTRRYEESLRQGGGP